MKGLFFPFFFHLRRYVLFFFGGGGGGRFGNVDPEYLAIFCQKKTEKRPFST